MSETHPDFVAGYRKIVQLLALEPGKVFRWHTYGTENNKLFGPLHDLESRTHARINHQNKEVFTHRSLWAQFVRKHLKTSPLTTDYQVEGNAGYWVVTAVDKEALTKLLTELKRKLRPVATANIARIKESPMFTPDLEEPPPETVACDWQTPLLALMEATWVEKRGKSSCEVSDDLRDKLATILEATK